MRDAIVLAAGEGTRLRPLTSTRPKPMLPVAGKPILEWNLEALAGSGFKKANIIVGYRKDVIEGYFGKSYGKLKLNYIIQKEQLGTGHAVLMAEDYIKDDFLVMNGDIIVSKNTVSDLVKSRRQDKADNCMALAEVSNPTEFGIVDLKRNRVNSLVEKPRKPASNLANAGVYIFSKDIIDFLRNIKKSKRLEYELTDAIKILIKEKNMHGHEIKDVWIDIGRPWDLLDANELMLGKMKLGIHKKVVVEKKAVLKGPVGVSENTVIRSGSYIQGPCIIGSDCTIGPNCFIRPHTTLMNNVHIGNAVEVKNSIVMNHSNIPHLSYVGDSIIGEHCNLGAGTNVANLRFDNAEVKIEIKRVLQGSGRRKLGCIIGDNVKTGINVSIMPGRAIYPGALVEAGSIVRNTIYME